MRQEIPARGWKKSREEAQDANLRPVSRHSYPSMDAFFLTTCVLFHGFRHKDAGLHIRLVSTYSSSVYIFNLGILVPAVYTQIPPSTSWGSQSLRSGMIYQGLIFISFPFCLTSPLFFLLSPDCHSCVTYLSLVLNASLHP